MRFLKFSGSADEKGSTLILFYFVFFGLFMITTRVVLTSTTGYVFLLWNLFLGAIPLLFSGWLKQNRPGGLKMILVFCGWLLFLPNSFYILTDLFHLRPMSDVPIWFDLALIISFAWTGLCFGIVSVHQVEAWWRSRNPSLSPFLFQVPVMALNAIGIYVGRFLRYNSWDIISNPFELAGDLLYLCIHPFRNGTEWGMILCYSLLLFLIYRSREPLNQ